MQKWFERFGQLFPIFLSFSLSFFAVQCTFLFQFHSSHILAGIFVSLAHILCSFGLTWICISTLFYFAPFTWLRWLKKILFSCLYLALIATAICDQYLLFAHERLDEAFLLFDWNEILMIADPVNRFSLSLVLGTMVLLVLPFLFVKMFNGFSLAPIRLLSGVMLFIILGLIPLNRELDFLTKNRFTYFITRSLQSVLFSKQAPVATLRDFRNLSRGFYGDHGSLDPRFPLQHRLNEPSLLNTYLSKTSDRKAPNIKVIIVESMSSDLFGQRGKNTGNLMPFMDSLSKCSLYFPNAFSTSQRTHNVLPAVLASVPNTIDGSVFQQLPFPRHFSLFNLLKKYYCTEFYCGVRLEYLNMVGLMSHYKTAYLIKNWNRKFQLHKESVGSAWGFPDEDLFKQAQYDDSCRFNKLQKPQFKLLLTISSHDPFIYPNKAKWEQVVHQKAISIKNKRLNYLVKSQAANFGAFSYVDSSLQRFFD